MDHITEIAVPGRVPIKLVYLVRVVSPPQVAGGDSLDKASNHPNSPDNPGGWLNIPRPFLRGYPKCTATPRSSNRIFSFDRH